MTRARSCLLLLLAALALAGCEWVAGLPKDPERTLDSVRGGSLRAGVIHAPPWVRANDGEPSGIEVDIVRQLAAELDAGIEWRYGAPDQLLQLLEAHELDLLIGGFEASSPMLRKVGLTRSYATTEWWVVGPRAASTDLQGLEIRTEHGRAVSLVRDAGGTPVYGAAGNEPVLRAVPWTGVPAALPPDPVMRLGTSKQVLAVPPGENAWVVTVDRSLERMKSRAGDP